MAYKAPPIQGDMKRLEQLSSGLKRTGGTYGPVVQRTPAGRPQGTGGTPAPRASAEQAPQLPPEHQALAQQVAQAEYVRQFWANVAQRFPGTYTQLYREQADSVARQIHEGFYQNTPNMEW